MLTDIIDRLTSRDTPRTEAEVQADVRNFILMAPFNLDDTDLIDVQLEAQVGTGRRIDVEVGSTVIEVKRDLRRGKILDDAVDQLLDYVRTRRSETGRRFVGVLTDGVEWKCFNLIDGSLVKVSELDLKTSNSRTDDLMVWLEGVLATQTEISPNAYNIDRRLGAASSSHQLDRSTLRALYRDNKELPTVKLKRQLWSRLLTSALGTQFEDTDELFVEHTLLVNSAEVIAHAVVGLDVVHLEPRTMLTGEAFSQSGIFGVVEADFFDWVVEVEEGPSFISTLASRLARFDWTEVDHDILKVLYESVIGADTRRRLGEYYTPDWLAQKIVEDTFTDPLNQRLLDPACGSGTFLFHSVRKYIEASDQDERSISETLNGLTGQILGMDLHPVAVTFARVTYLLAIGRERLIDPERSNIQIPIYLGDSMQWRQQIDLLSAGNLVVRTDDSPDLFSNELRFPDELLDDAVRFDRLVSELARRATNRSKGSPVPSLASAYSRLGIPSRCHGVVDETFTLMCQLYDDDRNHIWGYYVRNLARPIWLSRPTNRVDVIVGNPPWLAYRSMTPEMQSTFREMSVEYGLWQGASVATQQDLSGLFMARALQLYLREGGAFGLVLPNAVVDRSQYTGLRTGNLDTARSELRLEYDVPWDLRRIRPHIFPRGSAVLWGRRASNPRPMPLEKTSFSGRIPPNALAWADVDQRLELSVEEIKISSAISSSPYAERFRNGATVFPRVLFCVDEQEAGPLGTSSGRVRVNSTRSANEKKPWKFVNSLSGVIEREFVRPVVMSECLLPFRLTEPVKAILPIVGDSLLSEGPLGIDAYDGLADWWSTASSIWLDKRSSERLSLIDQLNYMRKLGEQLPTAELRVVYNKSGMHVLAAKVSDRRAVVENGLYWMTASSHAEADYLCALINSPKTTELVRPLMSYGKDERDVAKSIWQLPIPEFDPENLLHQELSEMGAALAEEVAEFSVDPDVYFPTTRRRFRDALETSEAMNSASAIVSELIDL